MKIFITGATGFIGNHLLDRLLTLLKADDRIFVLTRRPASGLKDLRLIPIRGSLEKIEECREALCESDYVFHLAANADFDSRGMHESVYFEPTQKMLAILRENSVLKNFIFISTIGAMDRAKGDSCLKPITTESRSNPRSEYGQFKLKSEGAIRSSGLPFTIIRPTWVYGRNMRESSHINFFVTMVARKSIIRHFNFPGRVSVIHVDDLVTALAGILHNPKVISKTYIAETESLTLGRIFKLIRFQLGEKNPKSFPTPPLGFLIRGFHHKLPFSAGNLFINYLWASDPAFHADFGLKTPKKFEKNIIDVIQTNALISGLHIITGANSGIGFALARLWEGQGKKLVLIDKKTDRLEAFSKQLVLKCDLSCAEDIYRTVQSIPNEKIFCLVNNAGVGFRGSLNELTLDQIEGTITTNILGTLRLTKLLLDRLRTCRSVIVNLASSVAFNPLPFMSVYAASKSFILHWSEALSYELRKTNHVVTVAPSGTNTNFQSSAGVKNETAEKTLLQPTLVARKIDKAIQKKKHCVLIGWKTLILLKIVCYLPRRLNIRFWGYAFQKMR